MFKQTKDSQSKDKKSRQDQTMISPPDRLLAQSDKRAALLVQLQEASDLDAARYESLCFSLIQRITAQCQQLPASTNQYYALPGGFLDQLLNRTEAAVTLLRDYLEPSQEGLSEAQRLWMYALFSAGLLQGIGRLQTDYTIRVFDGRSLTPKIYEPLVDDMLTLGRSYTYVYEPEDDVLRCRLTLMLAYQWMPKDGLIWLLSNKDVFAVWLALLDEDQDAMGPLGAILERAKVIADQRYLKHLTKNTQPNPAPKNAPKEDRVTTVLGPNHSDKVIDKRQILGAELIRWLKQQLELGNLVINQNKQLTLTKNGLLISAQLIKTFAQTHAKHMHWQTLLKAALAWMNLKQLAHSKTAAQHATDPTQTEITAEKELEDGFYIDLSVLPKEVHVYSAKEEVVKVVPSVAIHQIAVTAEPIEAIRLETLSINGLWTFIENQMPWIQLGMKSRV